MNAVARGAVDAISVEHRMIFSLFRNNYKWSLLLPYPDFVGQLQQPVLRSLQPGS